MFVFDFKNGRGYSDGQTSVGKSVPLLPTEQGQGWPACHIPIGAFKLWRAFFWHPPLILVFIYYYYYYSLFVQMNTSGAVVSVAWKLLQDLGSNPRSPKYFMYFFFSDSDAHQEPRSIMWPHNPACQVSWGQIQGPTMEEHIISQVKRKAYDRASQRGLLDFGPRSGYLHPSKYFSGPFSLPIFLYFILCLLIYLFILLTN